MQQTTPQKEYLSTLKLSEYEETENCIPTDAVLPGRQAGSSVTTSLGLLRATGAGAAKGGGGGGIRILKKRETLISRPHKIHKE